MIKKHRHSIRLQQLDYSLPNKFFVTLCAFRHGCYFEKYSKLKTIIEKEIVNIQLFFSNINISDSVIMPNHIHIIISINKKISGVTLGKIINVLKGKTVNKWLKVIKEDKTNEIACIWQRNYYEHRIRNDNELEKYKKYIELNPLRWQRDKYNPLNLEYRGFASRSPVNLK